LLKEAVKKSKYRELVRSKIINPETRSKVKRELMAYLTERMVIYKFY